MANIKVTANIVAPSQITINLVREDFLKTSNIFRIAFEVSLTLFSALFGAIISLLTENKGIPPLISLFTVILIISCVIFLSLSIKHYKDAKRPT